MALADKNTRMVWALLAHDPFTAEVVTWHGLVSYYQCLTNRLSTPGPDLGSHTGRVRRRERLDRLLRYDYRDAACPGAIIRPYG